MPGKDYYQTLGVSRQAGEKEIRQAFRRLARRHHPDVNPGSRDAERMFKEINEAYEVLSDPEKRRKYDTYGDQWPYADQFEAAQRAGGFRSARGGRSSTPFGFGGLGDLGDLANMEDLLGGLFRGRGGFGRERQPQKGRDVEVAAEITLEEAYTGTARMVQTRGGDGASHQNRQLEVTIPPGVRPGARVRAAGGGHQGSGGGPPGDLYVNISIRPHHRFERKGDHLYVEVPVPLTDAVLGCEVAVPTLKGTHLALHIPPESQNGQTFRLARQGMPKTEGGHGDLYARLKVILPAKLSQREKELFQELKALRPQ